MLPTYEVEVGFAAFAVTAVNLGMWDISTIQYQFRTQL